VAQVKKILVAIDTSRQGGNDDLLKTAQGIAKVMGGEIALLNVIEYVPQYVSNQLPEGLREEQIKEINSVLQKLAAQCDCSNAIIREGQPATEILEYASEIKADLIILQSHDPDISTYLIGSVASRVARHAHCSVYLVRQPESD
jgi:universal stress protein F